MATKVRCFNAKVQGHIEKVLSKERFVLNTIGTTTNSSLPILVGGLLSGAINMQEESAEGYLFFEESILPGGED